MRVSRKAVVALVAGSLIGASVVPSAEAGGLPFRKKKADPLLTNMPLIWKATTSITKFGMVNITGLSRVKIRFATMTDGRLKKDLVGENREEAEEGKIKPVATPDDVAAFLTEHIRFLLDENGIATVTEKGDVVLSGTIKRFFVVETNTYQGEVMLAMQVADAAGNVRWEGMVSGGAKRFGSSYKADNYCETLSDSVVEAMYKLLSSADFMAALRGQTK
jgi:hypothetical protein